MDKYDWSNDDCYFSKSNNTFQIGNSTYERTLKIQQNQLITTSIRNKLTGKIWNINNNTESSITIDVSKKRIEIPYWYYHSGENEATNDNPDLEEGFKQGFHLSKFNHNKWEQFENLYAPTQKHPIYEGYGWFRFPFNISSSDLNESISFYVGGYDHEDWKFYRVFINGILIGTRERKTQWENPRPFTIKPNDPAYKSLNSRKNNILAIQTKKVNKLLPNMKRSEQDRYFFRSPLLEQFINIGKTPQKITDFELTKYWPDVLGERTPSNPKLPYYQPKSWSVGGDREWMWCIFWGKSPSTNISIEYHFQIRKHDPLLRKRIKIRNDVNNAVRILDVDVEDLSINASSEHGGYGFPVILNNQAFCAIEHPAGVNIAENNRLNLRHHPGKIIEPRKTLTSKDAIFYVTKKTKALEGFHEYLKKNGQRKNKYLSIYDPCGMSGGYINQHDPLYHISEDNVKESLDHIDQLKKHNIAFDYYFLDVGWQDHSSDLTSFKKDNFPNGANYISSLLKKRNINFGLWFSVNYAPWSCGDYPPVKKCVGGTGTGYRGQDRICLDAEPYPDILKKAILHHIQETGIKGLKMDMSYYYCNETHHGHLPGKYSTESQMDQMIDIVQAATRICPDLFIMWYWGHNSPFWLLYGDTMQDKGLHGEGAEVAKQPSPKYRSSVIANLDQATKYAEFIPLICQDSLGTWMGNMIMWNNIGKNGWKDGWLMDMGRGNLMNQPWADFRLLSEKDIQFFSWWQNYLKDNWELFVNTKHILGSPWSEKPYGYVSSKNNHAICTIFNPSFLINEINLTPHELIEKNTSNTLTMKTLYPKETLIAEKINIKDSISMQINPFEVKVIEIGENLPINSSLINKNLQQTINIPIHIENNRQITNKNNKDRSELFAYTKGTLELPNINDFEHPFLNIVITLKNKGMQMLLRDLHNRFQIEAKSPFGSFKFEKTPNEWLQLGRGSSWIVFHSLANKKHSNQNVQFKISQSLPPNASINIKAWLMEKWWENE